MIRSEFSELDIAKEDNAFVLRVKGTGSVVAILSYVGDDDSEDESEEQDETYMSDGITTDHVSGRWTFIIMIHSSMSTDSKRKILRGGALGMEKAKMRMIMMLKDEGFNAKYFL